jgi:DNA helicase HerA-like ATPase
MNDVNANAPSPSDPQGPDLEGNGQAGAERLGKVAAPPQKESTSEFFYFWVERGKLVERTQIVFTESQLGGRKVEFVGLVEEVYRQSRQRDMSEEVDRFDADSGFTPPFASAGFTYAKVTILRTDPVTHAPPTEESTVYLGGQREAEMGYGVDRMGKPLAVGLLRNGGTAFAGPARIDLDFLLGKNGGHLNVNGIAGLGAKSSFLLHVNYLLLREAERQKRGLGGKPNRLQVVPIVFNVKNFDLFFIDHWGATWTEKSPEAVPEWKDLGVENPAPFKNAKFFAPQVKGGTTPVNVGRTTADVTPYSWGLVDVVEQRLFRYLFAEDDVNDANFGALVSALEDRLTRETPNGPKLSVLPDTPDTFQKLLEWLKTVDLHQIGEPHRGTLGKLTRRLRGLVLDGDGVLRREEPNGQPLGIPKSGDDPQGGIIGPLVVDLYGLSSTPSLQRFVVGAVFRRVQELRSGNTTEGLRYLITLDELNRFAPKNSSDPITEKIEQVAAEMRSQGVILLGAQQQASLVSSRVIENAGIRAVGRSGTLELSAEVWKFLGPAARSQAAQIQADEKLLIQASFRAPMLAKIPYPPWALSKEDAARPATVDAPSGTATAVTPKKPRFVADGV